MKQLSVLMTFLLVAMQSNAAQETIATHNQIFTVNSKVIKELKSQLQNQPRLKNPNLELPPVLDLKKIQNLQGGVSDGGGNAVGKTLFDFYENENSVALTHEAILNWDSPLVKVLEDLDLKLPKSDRNSFGFGEELRRAIRAKKWILETKQITSAGCLNQSLVQSRKQSVVACQNEHEVRIYAPWFLNQADQQNQTALITHEALLSWARAVDRDSTKEQLEYKIREINRQIYMNITSQELKESLHNYFSEYDFFSMADFQAITELDKVTKITMEEFCSGHPLSQSNRLRELRQRPLLNKELSVRLGGFERLNQQWQVIAAKKSVGTSSSDEEEAWEKERQALCKKDSGGEPFEEIPFKPEVLSAQCKKEVEISFQNYIQIHQNAMDGLYSLETSKILNRMNSSAADSAALLCEGLAGIELEKQFGMTEEKGLLLMKQVNTQAVKYFHMLKLQYEKNLK